MRIGRLAWRGLLFRIPAAAARGGAGPAGSLRGKGPICCMRLFRTRFSTGCHLFGDTLGRRDYGKEGTCVGANGRDFLQTACRLILTVVSISCVYCIPTSLPPARQGRKIVARTCSERKLSLAYPLFLLYHSTKVFSEASKKQNVV